MAFMTVTVFHAETDAHHANGSKTRVSAFHVEWAITSTEDIIDPELFANHAHSTVSLAVTNMYVPCANMDHS
jgi:hypothetical protein